MKTKLILNAKEYSNSFEQCLDKPAPKHSKMFSRNRYLSTLKTLSLQLNMMKRQDRPLYPMSPMKAQRQSLRMKKYAKILKPVTAHWFLFTMLRQKGVIKQIPDTELAETISALTR